MVLLEAVTGCSSGPSANHGAGKVSGFLVRSGWLSGCWAAGQRRVWENHSQQIVELAERGLGWNVSYAVIGNE